MKFYNTSFSRQEQSRTEAAVYREEQEERRGDGGCEHSPEHQQRHARISEAQHVAQHLHARKYTKRNRYIYQVACIRYGSVTEAQAKPSYRNIMQITT